MYTIYRTPSSFLLCERSNIFPGDRATDLMYVMSQEILRFRDNSGLLFNHLWSKPLRCGHICIKTGQQLRKICPVLDIGIHVKVIFWSNKKLFIFNKPIPWPCIFGWSFKPVCRYLAPSRKNFVFFSFLVTPRSEIIGAKYH